MGDDFLTRPRLSRIYYADKYFAYPLMAKDVLGRLGFWESFLCALSYIWAQRKRGQKAETFEDWVTARFGKRLYDSFFGPYTRRSGASRDRRSAPSGRHSASRTSRSGGPCSRSSGSSATVTTLIEEFKYPRKGPGQMWERFSLRSTTTTCRSR